MYFTRLTMFALCMALGVGSEADASPPRYEAAFHARFVPADGIAEARITIRQGAGELVRLDLAAPASRYHDFAGDGTLERSGERVIWSVPRKGGELTYRAVIDHRRNQGSASASYDARLTEHFALLRLGDLFPPARVRSRVNATSASTLSLAGPTPSGLEPLGIGPSELANWRFETRYGAVRDRIPIDDRARRFDRPTGWLVAGEIGVRREIIANRRVAIAGPTGEGIRRIDTLAFLRWTLPTLIEVFPDFPARLLIVSASTGMWRGGLSGPNSVYLHADRPLISENGTSTLLHELVHVATSGGFNNAADWLVEGLAEYYALETLRRSNGLSQRRFQFAFDALSAWSDAEDGQLRNPSTGPDTARAVLVLHALAAELDARGISLDTIVAEFPASEALDLTKLRAIVAAHGAPSKVLADLQEVRADLEEVR